MVVVAVAVTKSIVQQAIDEMNIFGWEDSFGVDNPDYLPYWVQYMPQDERIVYLRECGQSFLDFKIEMLSSDFDWESWKPQF